jgi:N-terminal acetyltransferase B complex catalytic subunit
MTTIRSFTCDDLFAYNAVNHDKLTETYSLAFYLHYLAKWPEYFSAATTRDGEIMGYVMGKCEGEGEAWHGHVSAVTVAPGYRRQGLAGRLMGALEEVTETTHNGYFVDLFVRVTNTLAIGMYKKLGYSVYRRVLNYYNGEDDAFDMRKALRRDTEKKSVVPSNKDWLPHELEWN